MAFYAVNKRICLRYAAVFFLALLVSLLFLQRRPVSAKPHVAPVALTEHVVDALGPHTATIFMIHGLGAQGVDMVYLAEYFGPIMPHVKFRFPNAPVRPVTVQGGARIPAWFDMLSFNPPYNFDPRQKEDELGYWQSVDSIQLLIDQEVQSGIPDDRIALAGFSQGGAMSLLLGLTSKTNFAGILALSGWLGMENKALQYRRSGSQARRIFMGHGTVDPVISYGWGQDSFDILNETLGMAHLEWHGYEGLGHAWTLPREMRDIKAFLQEVLS